jgi:PAS domain S-box-containing protein
MEAGFYARLLDALGQAVIATDLDGSILYWNRFADKLYGWSSAEAVGCNVLEITRAQLAQEQASAITSHVRQGKSWSGDFLVGRRDGSSFPSRVINSPFYDERGRLAGIVGVFLDISESNRATDDLRRQKELLQRILDNIPLMIAFVDKDGCFVLVNREWEHTLGLSPNEIKERKLDIITQCFPDPGYRRKVLSFISQSNGKWADFKARVRDGRGSHCPRALRRGGFHIDAVKVGDGEYR